MIIWIASYPRSGNTFFRVILNNIFGLNTYSIYNDNADIGSDEKTSDIVGHKLLPEDFDIEKARLSEQLYLIKTHDYPSNDQDKVIYLVRDGRESTLSYKTYIQNYSNTQKTLIDVIFGNVLFGGWGDHLANWDPKKRNNTLLIKFEELVDAPKEHIKKISDFISIIPKQEEGIPTFDQLKRINPKFFNQGKKDSWKDKYTTAEHSSFWLKNYKQMIEYGYVEDKPQTFDNENLVELLNIMSYQNTYHFNENLKNSQINHKYYLKILANKDDELKKLQSKIECLEKQFKESTEQLEVSNKKLLLQSNVLSNIKNKYKEINNISVYYHPYKKFRAYKSLIKTNSISFEYLSVISNTYLPSINKSNRENSNPSDDAPLFSIITITFNAADYLQSTIDSVVKQTYGDIEYIIIDGASNDSTLKIIKNNEKNITTWISEPDTGIYDAMNKGISLSKGRWVNFMNAGDTFSDEKVLENIAKNINSSADVIYGDRYYVKDNQRVLQIAKSIDTIFERMPFGHQSTFVKNDVLKKYRFNDTYKFSADYDLLIKLYLANHNFQYINIPICEFIAGGHSESGIRPYLEAMKILLDNTNDKNIIKSNAYFAEFKKNSNNILNSFIES